MFINSGINSRPGPRRLIATAVLSLPLIGVALAVGGAASAGQVAEVTPPEVTAAQAAAIAEGRLPGCEAIGAEFYYDEDRPMWFVETECSDETWQDLRIDAITGAVIAINGDYEV